MANLFPLEVPKRQWTQNLATATNLLLPAKLVALWYINMFKDHEISIVDIKIAH
jgi:hypothetical protein